jgi:dolichol-phosphate mannosyltransferase
MDCDLQDAPEDIEKLLAKALEGYDVVVATRDKEGHGPIKRNASRLFYWIFNLISGTKLDWSVGNFRVFSDKVATAFRAIREEERFLPAAFSWMGFDTGTVELGHHQRDSGSSSYSLAKLIRLALDAALSHSELPLRFVALFGFAMSVISIAFSAIYVLKAILVGTSVTGWTSLIVAISVLGSVQIFMIGVVGLYVGKTFREAKRRPLYLVKEYAGFDKSQSDVAPHSRKRPLEVVRLPDTQP